MCNLPKLWDNRIISPHVRSHTGSPEKKERMIRPFDSRDVRNEARNFLVFVSLIKPMEWP